MDFTDCVSDDDREISLRRHVAEKPKNARAMATLACLLGKKRSLPFLEDEIHREAVEWARKSVDVAPDQPFGHTALSILLDDINHRMNALSRAIDCSMDKKQHEVALVGLLVRRLVEPREYEAKRHIKMDGTAMKVLSPKIRPLNTKEQLTYEQIEEYLFRIWSRSAVSAKESEFIALREYRLGLFFRKIPDSDLTTPPTYSRSIHCFEAAINHFPPGHVHVNLAVFWLATLTSRHHIDSHVAVHKCPAEYIVGLYSTFASRFDDLLVAKLSYQTPELLRKLLHDTMKERTFPYAADLGCGTGLSGIAFAECVTEKFVGVDLSPEMLTRAKLRNCYHQLVEGDVTSILTEPSRYDLIIACDVFCYIGDLSDVFSQVHGALVIGGVFCFSTEVLSENVATMYTLHECARFAHKKCYLESLAAKSEFLVHAIETCTIRKNLGKDVKGLLLVLQKR